MSTGLLRLSEGRVEELYEGLPHVYPMMMVMWRRLSTPVERGGCAGLLALAYDLSGCLGGCRP